MQKEQGLAAVQMIEGAAQVQAALAPQASEPGKGQSVDVTA